MKAKPGGWRITICVAGLLAQLVGLACLLRPGIPEVNLALALLFYLPGTIAVLYALERWAEKKGRPGIWALTAVLGPVGPLALALLKPAQRPIVPAPTLAPVPRTRRDRVSGAALILLAVLGLAWTAREWWHRGKWPPIVTGRSMQEAEGKAYRRLREIQAAQEQYRQQDWDGDGRKTYASFLIHLWQSVDAQGRPIPARLLPRRLAFAMGEEFGLDSFFYRSLNFRDPPTGPPDAPRPEPGRLNPETEWALVAAPVSPRQTAHLSFLTDQSGRIWAHSGLWGGVLRSIPADLEAGGWVEIPSEQALRALQHTLLYQDHEIAESPKLHLRWRH